MSEEAVIATEKPARKPRAKKEKSVESAPVVESAQHVRPVIRSSWRDLIPEEFVEIQSYWLIKNGINVNDLTAEQKQELKERAGEENLVIKLGGFKHAAHNAGLSSVDYDLITRETDYVAVKCTIRFGDGKFSALANATKENTNYPFNMFLESMAENRAFSRACRMALNINILGAEELNPTTAEFSKDTLLSDDEGCTSPQDSLKILIENRGKTFADLKQSLIKKSWSGAENWNDFKEIPSDQCLVIISTIQSKPAKSE